MPAFCGICKRNRGSLNKTNWQRHVESCNKKIKKTQIITPSSSSSSLQNYFSKKRKIDETFELGKYLSVVIINVLDSERSEKMY